MAPKNKFTREETVNAALSVVRMRGAEGLTAKSVAEALGVSTRPIFSYFDTMDALKAQVRLAAEAVWKTYLEAGLGEAVPFFGFGMEYIRFAREEPHLYRLVFLQAAPDGESGAVKAMDQVRGMVRPSLERIYGITTEEADCYFRDMWLVVHSLATLIVTGGCPYSDEEIGKILTGVSVSVCKALKEIPGFAAGEYDRDAIFTALIG